MKIKDITINRYLKNKLYDTIEFFWSIMKNKEIPQQIKNELRNILSQESKDLYFEKKISKELIEKYSAEEFKFLRDKRSPEEFYITLLINELHEATSIIYFKSLGYDIKYNPRATQKGGKSNANPDFILFKDNQKYFIEQETYFYTPEQLIIKLSKYESNVNLCRNFQKPFMLNKVILKNSDKTFTVKYNIFDFNEAWENDKYESHYYPHEEKKKIFGGKPYVIFTEPLKFSKLGDKPYIF